MQKNKLIKELHELLYTVSVKFIKKHKLLIDTIKIECDETIIIEHTTIIDSPSMTKTYIFSNTKLNRELNDG